MVPPYRASVLSPMFLSTDQYKSTDYLKQGIINLSLQAGFSLVGLSGCVVVQQVRFHEYVFLLKFLNNIDCT